MLKYKGYVGNLVFDDGTDILAGEVINIGDVITYQGKSMKELRQAFRDSVEDYLAFCVERGEEPESPSYSPASLAQGHHTTVDIEADVTHFLVRYDHAETAEHVADVARESAKLARRFGVDARKAGLAGWLHDISAVIPNEHRIQAARDMGIDILPEEERFPMILHQKLSVPIAREIFGVADPGVLSAIECHTTLKANASMLDRVLFVADKIAWDQPGTPPYIDGLMDALDRSLDAAALAYIDYLWQRREQLRVLHPWLVAARQSLMTEESR